MVPIIYKDSTIQKGYSHKVSVKLFVLVPKSKYSSCFPQHEK